MAPTWSACCLTRCRQLYPHLPIGGDPVVISPPTEIHMTRIRKGFTLIELLIVVVIIGILAAIAIPKFANTKTKAYQTAMKSDLRNLVTAEEAFFSDSGYYKPYVAIALLGDTFLHFRPSTGVSKPVIATSPGAWYASVTHSQIPAPFSCSIGVNTPNTLVTTAGDGEPVCK
jgi:prepilin-type N-terminal cleavage/methylation domain-containing protein